MTLAVEGYGTTLATSPDNIAFTAVAEVVNIEGPEIDGKVIDATHLTSPNAFMEFIPGILDAGELKCTLNFTKAQYATTYGQRRTVLYYKLTLPTGSTLVCQGFLSKLGWTIPHDDKISVSATWKFTGQPTFTQ